MATIIPERVRPRIDPRPDLRPRRIERTVTLTFDDAPDGSVINTRYAGLVLSALLVNPTARGPVHARRLDAMFSGAEVAAAKNVLSIRPLSSTVAPMFSEAEGAIEVRFEQLQRAVTVQAFAMTIPGVMGHDDNRPYLDAYDDAGNRLGRVRTAYGPMQPQSFDWHWLPLVYASPSMNIRSIRLSVEAMGSQGVQAVFDALTYTVVLLPLPGP